MTSNFSIFPQCFLSSWRTFHHFHQIQNSSLQTLSVWKSLNFFVWKGVKIRLNQTCTMILDLHNASFLSQACWINLYPFLTHYQTTNFRLFLTERVSRRHFHISRKWKKVIQTGRKHCGKKRNCSLRAISPFPTVFSKGLFPRGVKRCHCVGMG